MKEEFADGFRARIAALRPSGPISSQFLSDNVAVLVVGDSVFVHGGLLSQHVSYGLEKINEEVRDWIHGLKGRTAPEFCHVANGVVRLRKFSRGLEDKCDCSALEHVLATIPSAKRMIMGHTIQEFGINGICNETAIRIDVGMSKGCINGIWGSWRRIHCTRTRKNLLCIMRGLHFYARTKTSGSEGLTVSVFFNLFFF